MICGVLTAGSTACGGGAGGTGTNTGTGTAGPLSGGQDGSTGATSGDAATEPSTSVPVDGRDGGGAFGGSDGAVGHSGTDASGAAPSPGAALVGLCPSGFTPQQGKNSGFVSDGIGRVFHVMLPSKLDTPRPVFVALTGTVQEEISFASQSGLDQLPGTGFIVLVPVRTCSQNGTNCTTTGTDGRVWEPWYDATIPAGDNAGPDVRFVEAMVRCVATKFPVDQGRIYVGGISAGGSFTNRNMTFNSTFFAGGVAASGDWNYFGSTPTVPPATPQPMANSIVIVNWGGPNDQFPPAPPYAGETKAAAAFYATQSNVVTVACSGTLGHQWPAAMTSWFVQTLLSHPKGSDRASFKLTTPPAGFHCVLGAYTDH